jgi:predicted nucleotidyltransferase
VDAAVRNWAEAAAKNRAEVLCIGYFGSYARGDWGVGSDLDIVIVVEKAAEPFERRSAKWDATTLPVPADLLVYTKKEWDAMDPRTRFGKVVREETVWVFERKAD